MDTLLLLTRPVKEFMTTDLITVNKDSTLTEVKNIFESNLIHHIPVTGEKGKLEGIISKSDFLLLLDWGTKLGLPSSNVKNQHLFRSNVASDIMQANLVSVRENDKLEKCVDILKENYFRAIPVVDENKKLLGIITIYDLMVIAFNKDSKTLKH
ncbi:MAG TPA: CBS domain-containing protein [Saprospiraceae bacterium]|nr:CBS domain-containing protein [Saprospiraceae bacterium]